VKYFFLLAFAALTLVCISGLAQAQSGDPTPPEIQKALDRANARIRAGHDPDTVERDLNHDLANVKAYVVEPAAPSAQATQAAPAKPTPSWDIYGQARQRKANNGNSSAPARSKR
jgi:hypothetical protein